MMPIVILLLLAFFVPGCQTPAPTPTQTETTAARVDTDEAKERALSAFKEFEKKLKGELGQALADGGPVNGIEVCHQRAPEITAELSAEVGFTLGRASHKTRNPAGKGPEWLQEYLQKNAGKPAQEAAVEVFELEDGSTGVARPIGIAPLCLTCHGAPEEQSPELREALKRHYPEDQAVGFKEGDFRGAFWAEISKE